MDNFAYLTSCNSAQTMQKTELYTPSHLQLVATEQLANLTANKQKHAVVELFLLDYGQTVPLLGSFQPSLLHLSPPRCSNLNDYFGLGWDGVIWL